MEIRKANIVYRHATVNDAQALVDYRIRFLNELLNNSFPFLLTKINASCFRLLSAVLIVFGVLAVCPPSVVAQDEAPMPVEKEEADRTYTNSISGEFTPAKGFDIFKSERGSLNISFYALFRYLNQVRHILALQHTHDQLAHRAGLRAAGNVPGADLEARATLVEIGDDDARSILMCLEYGSVLPD
jgi:hypothetical protein